MTSEELKQRLKTKPDPAALAAGAIADPAMFRTLLEIAVTDRGSIKYACTKIVRLASEQEPAAVYPFFDTIAGLIRHPNSFVQWDGITIMANLLAVDVADRFAGIRQEYLDLVHHPQMITAATVVGNAWKIVQAKPALEPEVTRRILAIPQVVYLYKGEPSPECNRVLCGHALACLDRYYDQSGSQAAILDFARSQLASERPAVARKAAQFLKQHVS